MRSGHFLKQPGYESFIPAPLPPKPPLALEGELLTLLSEADSAMGRLDGFLSAKPDLAQVAGLMARQEARFSGAIDGRECGLGDMLSAEFGPAAEVSPETIQAVDGAQACLEAMERAGDRPVNLRMIRDLHARLFRHSGDTQAWPGEFRKSQNWIGPPGSGLRTAVFVPPPVHAMTHALDRLDRFLLDRETFPALVSCALAHAQFLTIHPFARGNGLVARLLVSAYLRHRALLHGPALMLSHYLKHNRAEYFDRLMAVRTDGNWEGWVGYFLRALRDSARQALTIARAVAALHATHRKQVAAELKRPEQGLALLDLMMESPVIHISGVAERLGCVYVTADRLVRRFVKLGLLCETTGQRRNRRYRYDPCLALFPES